MKLILTTAAASVALAFPTVASAAPGGSGATSQITGTASAEVIAPLQITCGAMHWGQLAPQHTASTITMPSNGNPLVDTDNISVPGARTNAAPGHCDVTGEAGLTYTVTLPTSETLTSSSNTMTMTNFTISSDLDATPSDWLNRTLANVGGVGQDGFGIGATLNVGGDQPAGFYTGTYSVSVQYN